MLIVSTIDPSDARWIAIAPVVPSVGGVSNPIRSSVSTGTPVPALGGSIAPAATASGVDAVTGTVRGLSKPGTGAGTASLPASPGAPPPPSSPSAGPASTPLPVSEGANVSAGASPAASTGAGASPAPSALELSAAPSAGAESAARSGAPVSTTTAASEVSAALVSGRASTPAPVSVFAGTSVV